MAKLDMKVRRYIVRQLACYDTPTQVARAVKEEYGVEITRMQAAAHDPTKAAGANLARELCELFTETRAKFRTEVDEIPIASQAFRLRVLSRMQQRAEDAGNAALAAQLLEQAAKEIGGAYTDRRRIIGDPANPIPVQHGGQVTHLHDLTDADLERIAGGGGA
jgi:hypothetical protein